MVVTSSWWAAAGNPSGSFTKLKALADRDSWAGVLHRGRSTLYSCHDSLQQWAAQVDPPWRSDTFAMFNAAPALLFNGLLALGVTADVTSFIARERPIALQAALDNIGPMGLEVPGAAAGLVIASPSKENPNCEENIIICLDIIDTLLMPS